MTMDFGSHWIASKGAPIDYKGNLVYPTLELKLEQSAQVHIQLKTRSPVLRLGCILGIRNGTGEIASQRGKRFVLWQDSAPDVITADVRVQKGKQCVLHIYNVWSFPDSDSVQCFTGNAGLLIEETGDKEYLLRCSSGPGDPDFSELEIHVSLSTLPRAG
jgi:hypothetical protein